VVVAAWVLVYEMYGLLCVERERDGEGYVRKSSYKHKLCAHDGYLQ